jgi:hypothetical protein
MAINRDTHSPSVRKSLAYDEHLDPTLNGIDVLAPGRLTVIDIEGNTWEHTFAGLDPSATAEEAFSNFPYRLKLQIREIVGDGSGNVGTSTGTTLTISPAQIIGLH